jgi:hypothetical protein
MQGTIAQAVALTTHGNASLLGPPSGVPQRFFPDNSTFTFCESVRFVSLKRVLFRLREQPYAETPAAWFDRLRQDGVRRLRLAYGPTQVKGAGSTGMSDRMSVAFIGGGGRWLLEAIATDRSDFWEGRWETGDRERADQKIWRVTYGRIGGGTSTGNDLPLDLGALTDRLRASLEAIRAFASGHDLEPFVSAFDKARAALMSNEPLVDVYHKDLLPPGASPLSAARLLAAAQHAWVFGGMGSWNDMGFEGDDQRVYDRVSEELFQLLNAVIVASANTALPAA